MVTNSGRRPGERDRLVEQDIALQLLEQSPIMFDELVFGNRTADSDREGRPAAPGRHRARRRPARRRARALGHERR